MSNLKLRPSDYRLLAVVALFMGSCAAITWALARNASLPVMIVGSLILSIACQIALFRRAEGNLNYRQIEALVSVVTAVHPTVPLPPMRGWSVSADFAAILIQLVKQRRPQLMLEFGSGVSTIVAAYCLRQVGRGHLVSIEHDAMYASQTRENLMTHGLADLVTVVDAPLVSIRLGGKDWVWYQLNHFATYRSIDLLVVDGPPAGTGRMARFPALPMTFDRLSPDAAILMDDAGRKDEQQILKDWMISFPGFRRQDIATEKGTAVLYRSAEMGSPARREPATSGRDV